MSGHDALIIGTRCAGAALAMLLARAGCKVLGIDRAQFPSDTVSTHFLWPRTTTFLARWGLLEKLAATGCPAIHSVTADYGAVHHQSGEPPRSRAHSAALWQDCAIPRGDDALHGRPRRH